MLLLGSFSTIIIGSKALWECICSYCMFVIVDVWYVCNTNEWMLIIMVGLQWNGNYFGCLLVELSKVYWYIILFLLRIPWLVYFFICIAKFANFVFDLNLWGCILVLWYFVFFKGHLEVKKMDDLFWCVIAIIIQKWI